MTMSPPKPIELAMRIVSDVAGGVRFDLTPVRAQLTERLREPDGEYVWPRAERIASEALEECWADELADECARALADAHEFALIQAQRCLDAARDLEDEGVDSWIAGAVVHNLASTAVFDVLMEDGYDLMEEGCFGPEAA